MLRCVGCSAVFYIFHTIKGQKNDLSSYLSIPPTHNLFKPNIHLYLLKLHEENLIRVLSQGTLKSIKGFDSFLTFQSPLYRPGQGYSQLSKWCRLLDLHIELFKIILIKMDDCGHLFDECMLLLFPPHSLSSYGILSSTKCEVSADQILPIH